MKLKSNQPKASALPNSSNPPTPRPAPVIPPKPEPSAQSSGRWAEFFTSSITA